MDTSSFRISDLVLHNDHQLIALNKPAGIAVQSSKSKEKSLLDLAEIYAKTRLYPTFRLDQPVTGLALFAKNPEAAAAINKQLSDRSIKKTYLAITGKKLPEESGKLVHHLKKDGRSNRSLITTEDTEGSKKAELDYRYRGASQRYFLYEIDLVTGRHHQIRAQLGAMECPVRGDEKYGFKRRNPDRSIDLLAWKISFTHPTTNERLELEAPLPESPVWKPENFEL